MRLDQMKNLLHFKKKKKKTTDRMKKQPKEWEKILVSRTSEKFLMPKIHKDLNSIARK
jgi:hypothetical protein